MPHPGDDDERVAAADPGRGGPEPAPGLGVGGEEPDGVDEQADEGVDRESGSGRPAAGTPFRTPEPPQR